MDQSNYVYKTEFNRRFHSLLIENNLTTRQASEKLGVSYSTVSRWCRNIEPDVSMLILIIRIFNLPADHFTKY